MATYQVSVMIETLDGNDEESAVEQAVRDLAAEHSGHHGFAALIAAIYLLNLRIGRHRPWCL